MQQSSPLCSLNKLRPKANQWPLWPREGCPGRSCHSSSLGTPSASLPLDAGSSCSLGMVGEVPEPGPDTMHSPPVWKRTLPGHECTGTFHLARPSLPEKKPWDTREGAEAEAGDTGHRTLPGMGTRHHPSTCSLEGGTQGSQGWKEATCTGGRSSPATLPA